MKKYIQYTAILFCFSLGMASCIKNDSVGIVKDISDITIKTVRDTFNVNFGYPLVIEPEISQDMGDKELTYEWAFRGGEYGEMIVISTEKNLNHSFKKSGKLDLRYKVTNEDGSTFKNIKVFVNMPFEEGILILSNDSDNKTNLSFINKLTAEQIDAGVEESAKVHCFRTVNPDITIKGCIDVDQSQTKLILTSPLDKKIYMINNKSFDFLNDFDCSTIDGGFAPKQTLSLSVKYGINYVLGDDKRVYLLDSYTQSIIETNDFGDGEFEDYFEQYAPGYGGTMDNIYMVNYSNSLLSFKRYYGYADSKEGFVNDDIISICYNKSKYYVHVISRPKDAPGKIKVSILKNYLSKNGTVLLQNEYSFDDTDFVLEKGDKILESYKYSSAYFFKGNKLYRWFFNNVEEPVPTTPILTLPEGMEITSLSMSKDYESIYMGVYDSNSSEKLKGSLYIYDASELGFTLDIEPSKKFENVADRISKVIYKYRY